MKYKFGTKKPALSEESAILETQNFVYLKVYFLTFRLSTEILKKSKNIENTFCN